MKTANATEQTAKKEKKTMKTASILTKNQKKNFRAEWTDANGAHVLIAQVRHDDECGNGHNTFSITGTLYGERGDRRDGSETTKDGARVYVESCGCLHDEIVERIPALAPFIKWHLMSTDEPMHYIENTIYLAGDRDCWGLRKGEFKQHTSRGPHQNGGIEGVPNWTLEIPDQQARDVYAAEKPAPVLLEWKACGRTGEGKARELDAARRSAIWPEATDADLMQEPEALRAALIARHPALMAEFRAAVESLGFIY